MCSSYRCVQVLVSETINDFRSLYHGTVLDRDYYIIISQCVRNYS